MDSSISFKPSLAALGKPHAVRDPVAVREAVATDLDGAKAVAAAGDGGAHHDEQRGGHSREHPEHPPQDVVVDPESRDVLYRERDVRSTDQLSQQALMQLRAYQPAHPPAAEADGAPTTAEPHADIKA
jgi:hypothetical protein